MKANQIVIDETEWIEVLEGVVELKTEVAKLKRQISNLSSIPGNY